jgi:hypothetical protein
MNKLEHLIKQIPLSFLIRGMVIGLYLLLLGLAETFNWR